MPVERAKFFRPALQPAARVTSTRFATIAIYGGFPLGFGLGVAVYGGIGWLLAGPTGFAVGVAVAAGFALVGLVTMLRFWRNMADFERARARLEAQLSEGVF